MRKLKKERQEKFRAALADEMDRRDVKQTWLQAVTGIKQQNISQIVNGKRGVSEKKMLVLAGALGLDLEEMIRMGGNSAEEGSNIISVTTNHGEIAPVVNNMLLPHMGDITKDVCEQIARKMAGLDIDRQIELRSAIKDVLKRFDDVQPTPEDPPKSC